ncbi:response regulator [Acidicapsa ligni]|uniref:response regulator n=1 Tax=Acidicapsa ligni TaxID=542300 RepID=UPI0021E0062E|nr:response regulator transcription factor [Acidicapsa ligni]
MTSSAQIKVLAVDDHLLLRKGIAAVIEEEHDMLLVGEAATGQEAIERIRDLRPDVTLMDLQLPDMNGIDVIAAIRKEFPKARIVVLTTYRGDIQALRALQAGASGYLLKTMIRKDLLETIRTVHSGRRHVPPEVAAGLAEHVAMDQLSEREISVLTMVARGISNKNIAAELGVTERTIKGHVSSILSKLGANDRTHAVTIAMKRGFIDPI